MWLWLCMVVVQRLDRRGNTRTCGWRNNGRLWGGAHLRPFNMLLFFLMIGKSDLKNTLIPDRAATKIQIPMEVASLHGTTSTYFSLSISSSTLPLKGVFFFFFFKKYMVFINNLCILFKTNLSITVISFLTFFFYYVFT